MPEGDTLYRTAAGLRRAIAGRTVTRFETRVPAVASVDEDWPVAGRGIAAVEARGKHLLIRFAPPPDAPPETPDLVLHTHLRMTGSWHIYRPGEPWLKPERYAKVVLHTDAFVTPCFSAPLVELMTAGRAARHPTLLSLGPDAMTEGFDAEEAVRRLRRRPGLPLGEAIMDQRLLAGVGNVYKSEVLFVRRLSPFRPVGSLEEAVLRELVEEAQRLLRANESRGVRRTVFGLDGRERLWVYGRAGDPCRACGEAVRMRRQGADLRMTYFCPRCQAA